MLPLTSPLLLPQPKNRPVRTPHSPVWQNNRKRILALKYSSRTGDQQVETAAPQLQQRQVETTNATDQQQDAVDRLERSYQQEAVPNSAVAANNRRAVSGSKLRPLYIRHALPILRTVRLTERRLEADLATVATTVVLVVGVIVWDRGIESMLDGLLGESPLGSVFCILFGLGLVVGVRLTGGKVRDIFSV